MNIDLAYTLDKRALAIWRMLLGSLVLLDLSIRYTDLSAFYTNEGFLPVHFYKAFCTSFPHFSIHHFSEALIYQQLLAAALAIASLLFIAGVQTKISGVICWFLLSSLNTRNPLILQGGDDLLRLGIFWSIFLPTDHFYTLFGKKNINRGNTFKSITATGLMIQIACVYFFSALQKSSPEWHSEGSALYYALSLDQIVFPAGKWLYQFHNVLPLLTHLVYYIELIAPLLLFVPYKNNMFRLTGIVLLMLFHAFAGITLFVGLFSFIGITMLFSLLPSTAMDWFSKHHIDEQEPPQEEPLIKKFAIAFLSVYIIAWNMGNAPVFPYKMKPLVATPGHWLRLDQNWGVFAPRVYKEDGWFILAGYSKDSSVIDIYRNGHPVSFQKPQQIVSEISSDRWRKLGEHLESNHYYWLRDNYCRFKLKEWNTQYPERKINKLELIYMLEMTLPDYRDSIPVKKILCTCYQ